MFLANMHQLWWILWVLWRFMTLYYTEGIIYNIQKLGKVLYLDTVT